MNLESLIGPSLIGAGAFLVGLLAGKGRRRLRRVYYVLECRRHGLFSRHTFDSEHPVCPMCGVEMRSLRVTPWPERRKTYHKKTHTTGN
jgi:ribosomal protein L37E